MNNYFVRLDISDDTFIEYCVNHSIFYRFLNSDWINGNSTFLYKVTMSECDALKMKLSIETLGIMNLGKETNHMEKS